MRDPAGRRGRLPIFLILVVLGFSGPAAAAGRDESPARPWKYPLERLVLATGIPCLYQKDTSSPTTVVGLFIAGGTSAVPAGLDGLAAVSTRLLLEIPDDGKVRDLMAQATRLSYVCLEDCSIVLIECLTEHLEEALQVAAKIVQDPLITGLRVGRAKDLMAANAKIGEDDVVSAGRSAIFRGLFGGRGYGSALYGTEDSLKAIDRKDILAFTRRFLVKPNLFFCVETDIDRDPVRRLLERFFAVLPDGTAADLPRQDPLLPADRDIRLEKDTKQTYVGRAYALPRAGLSDMARGIVLETLLGKGPGSRLWALRVDERLAYSVDADVTWMKSAGVLVAHLETDRSKRPEAAAALGRLLETLRENGVTEEEMAATRTLARARFLRETESKSQRLRTIGLYETLGPGLGSPAAILEAVGAVTRDEMNAFVRDVLDPARALRITVGSSSAGPPER